jgi:hypothetical protein
LLREFFRLYLRARLLGPPDVEVGNAFDVFSASGIEALQQTISDQALHTPVVLTERLSNRVFAIHIVMGADESVIALNTRFRVDPDYLVHALLEEFAHAQQFLDRVDFEAQRIAYPYSERPYEQKAKHIATDILGYDPSEFDVYLVREEPAGILYDRPVEEL